MSRDPILSVFFVVRTAINVIVSAFELRDENLIVIITAKNEKHSLKKDMKVGADFR